MQICQSHNSAKEIIKRIGPTEPYRTLGAYISADGHFDLQLKVLTKKTRDWAYKIRHSALNKADRLLAYDAYLLPQVLYPISCMYAGESELRRAHRAGLETALNSLSVNRKYPRDIAYASRMYFGLELIDYAVSQGLAQMELYVGHSRKHDRTGQLMQIEREHIELVIGKGKFPLA